MSELDGGPAFPLYIPEKSERFPTGGYTRAEQMIGGMTLRDYFAAKAMRKMMPWNSEYPTEEIERQQSADFDRFCRMVAETAYGIADAMLKERSK